MRNMKFLPGFVALLLAAFVPCGLAAASQDGIAAVVNEDIVTLSDVEDRMKLIMVSGGLPDTQEMRSRLQPQILNVLVEESIKLQEAQRRQINVDEPEIEARFAALAQSNKMNAEQFRDVLANSGIPVSTLKDQIRAQLAWTKLVQDYLHPQITLGESDVEARLNRLAKNLGKKEYFLSEIFLPFDLSANDEDVAVLARRLVTEIKDGKAPFPALAQQFSQAAGAAQGGEIGWVQLENLPAEIAQAVAGMERNSVSAPITTPMGYHIIAVRNIREITEDTIPPRDVMMNRIGMERLDRAQQSYLLDLKADSFIEKRV
jgi:peptidyl-prolyl cis-trans isomerase SurA